MLKSEIEKVLEEMHETVWMHSQIGDYSNKFEIISQALTRILELVEKCVPIEADAIPETDYKSGFIDGWNQALAEIKGRIG